MCTTSAIECFAIRSLDVPEVISIKHLTLNSKPTLVALYSIHIYIYTMYYYQLL